MPYQYLEHLADMGIKGIGKTQEEAFEEAAKAMFNLMVDIEKVRSLKSVKISVASSDLPELFVEWLNGLLAQKDLSGLIFGDFQIASISEIDSQYQLIGEAFGEPLNPARHNLKTEVKAATFSGLKCARENGNFYCQCVVDI